MSQLAVTVIGPDRPGIIADVTEALAQVGVNLEDSTMTLLRGHFAMMIVCSGPLDPVREALEPLRGELVITVREVGPDTTHAPIGPPYLLAVHGADRPGIVSAVTRMIASVGGTVTDLSTRLSGSLYVLTAEVEIPPTAELATLQRALEITAEELGVGVTLRPTESDDL
ncbi:glycine cleavage system transcriptional repressor [Kribbella amoyensis]|uniref:Glycine cleavage system transcriptional repressor n=1 Tax=Kribbella amoyensis TaxID=996641 RepID=A0A561BJ98_9ACTN|nr:ACT domain-containing protein [Kribbella amoyensis]TWD78961.1 glycine cleavage system transcriptional repressor [Kribbella amoyensis]